MKKKNVKMLIGALAGVVLAAQLFIGGVFDSQALLDVNAEETDGTTQSDYDDDWDDDDWDDDGGDEEEEDFVISSSGVLTEVNIPDANLLIPETVGTIDLYTLPNTEKTVTIPKSVTKIDPKAFMYAGKLKEIKVAKNNKKFTSGGKCLYTKDKKTLLAVPQKLKQIKFTKKIKTIKSYAFAYSCMKEIKIPKTVKKINSNAFYYCRKLRKLTIDKNTTSISKSFIDGDNVRRVASTCGGVMASKAGYVRISTTRESRAYRVAKKIGMVIEIL